MRAFVLLAFVLVSLTTTSMSIEHPVPTNRQELKGEDWFPYVLSKIAPLERWRFAKSPEDLRPSDFADDYAYRTTIQDHRNFPLFCFSLFRPRFNVWQDLLAAIKEQPGPIFWQFKGDCLVPSSARWVGIAPLESQADIEGMMRRIEEVKRNPPKPDPEFAQEALREIPRFCRYLESRLRLVDKQPQQFDTDWLTKEGLSQHPAQYEDFLEAGGWAVFLSRTPRSEWQQRSGDTYLHFGIPMFGAHALLNHLGANWERYDEQSGNPILPEYPMLSNFDDISADYAVLREQVRALIAECTKAQNAVDDKQSLRALDLILRAGRWAEKLDVGLVFQGQ